VPDKPKEAAGYRPEDSELALQVCLTLATALGDLMAEIVIVGGLVPLLWRDSGQLDTGAPPPVGTVDLDLGLSESLLEEGRYMEMAERLRRAGFIPDTNAAGRVTPQRWTVGDGGPTIDFLIDPLGADDRPGRVKHLDAQRQFAAIAVRGVSLAMSSSVGQTLEGITHRGEKATRAVCVCNPGVFVVLKALAFRGRGEPKDAHDLYYALRYSLSGPEEIGLQLNALGTRPEVVQALAVLRADFESIDHAGPIRVAEFLAEPRSEELRADVVAFVRAFLRGAS
jgi:hypothetical protein